MNGTHLWYCDICDKTIIIKIETKQFNSKTHEHREKYGTVVKEYEFIHPEIDEVNYLLNVSIAD